MRRTHNRLLTSLAAPLAATGLVLSALMAVPAAAQPAASSEDSLADVARAQGESAPANPRTRRDRAGSGGVSTQATNPKPVRREAVLRDPNPDFPAPSDQRRLREVKVSQDVATGQVTAQARFAAAPTAASESILTVALGRWDGNNCILGAALMGTAQSSSTQGLFGDNQPFTVARSRSGATLTLRSTSGGAQLRALDPECTYAALYSAPDGDTVYHSLFAESLQDIYPPKLIVRPGKPVQGNYAGKVTKIRVEVRNDSMSQATGVRLRATGKSMKIAKPARNLGAIDQRSSKRGIVYKVRLRGAKPRKLVFRATTAGRTFTKAIQIARKPKPTRLRSLTGRYFWGHKAASVDTGWDNHAAYFVNKRFVHLGFPKGGKRPACGKVTKSCKRYTYNPRTGKLKIATAKPVRVNSEGFRFRGATYYPTTLAKKGQRFNVRLMRHDFKGNCLIYCNTWTEWLDMRRNGRFVLSRMDIGSIGGPGGPGGIWGFVDPDEKGTYRVIAPGRVQLTFANGEKKRFTLAIDHDVRNKPSPGGAGLILGKRNFYLVD